MAAISNLLVTVFPSDPDNSGKVDFGRNLSFVVSHFDLHPLLNRTGLSDTFLVV